MKHAPIPARHVIDREWKKAQRVSTANGWQCRLIIAHELGDGVGEDLAGGQVLEVTQARSLVQSKPSPLQAALQSARSQAQLERVWRGVRSTVEKVATPAEAVVSGAASAAVAGTATAVVVGAALTVEFLSAMAAALVLLDPAVAVQFRRPDGQVLTVPVVAWDW